MSLSPRPSKPKALGPVAGRKFIPAQTGTGFCLYQGDRLTVIDLHGAQVSDLYCVMISNVNDWLSSGRTIDYNDKILFSTGDILYSQDGHPMLKIIKDSCGRNDFTLTPCSQQMFNLYRNCSGHHPSCKQNLIESFKALGVHLGNIGTTFNIYMNVTFDLEGRIQVERPRSKPGDEMTFEALADLYIGLTACADEGSNGGSCKPIEFEIRRPRKNGI